MFCLKSEDEKIFKLSIRLGQSLRRYSKQEEIDEPSLLQLQAMFFLLEKPQASMHQLAEHLSTSLAAATVLVDRLVKSEWVNRASDANDRRLVRLKLSEMGEKATQESLFRKIKRLKLVLNNITKDDKKTLLRILNSLTEKIESFDSKGGLC